MFEAIREPFTTDTNDVNQIQKSIQYNDGCDDVHCDALSPEMAVGIERIATAVERRWRATHRWTNRHTSDRPNNRREWWRKQRKTKTIKIYCHSLWIVPFTPINYVVCSVWLAATVPSCFGHSAQSAQIELIAEAYRLVTLSVPHVLLDAAGERRTKPLQNAIRLRCGDKNGP